MFWRFGGYANISAIDTILDKEHVAVEELLDESDLIQELKQQNSKLIEFLRDEPVLKKLLGYVIADAKAEHEIKDESKEKDEEKVVEQEKTTAISFFGGKGKGRARSKSASTKDIDDETEQEKREAQQKKFAYVACEVLSSEVWSITDAILDLQDHLREFWMYMHRPAPLDPLLAGYFTRVNEVLLDKKTVEMLAFFKSLDRIVPAMLQHVDCPMVMDLLLKIISLEKHEGGQGIVDWLQSQDLIPLLLAYLSPEHSSATQSSAGDFLKAIITISANATTQDTSVIGPNELTRQLVSEKCITSLIADMLRGGNALTVGVGIIIEVIRKNNSDYDLDNQLGPEPKASDPIYLGSLLRQFANHVPEFMRLIRAPSARKNDLKAAFGRKIEPLGFDRFKTCELMAELLHCSNMALLNERGAEEDVKRRDEERERIKAEGKLTTPRATISPSHENSYDEFGSSVDSHGFHHAERPSDAEMDEKVDEARGLEVQNAFDEDGFEKVNAPESVDELPDEVTFEDFNEKTDTTTDRGTPPLETAEEREPIAPEGRSPQTPPSPSVIPAPLSPKKANSPAKLASHSEPPPTQIVESPTAIAMAEGINSLDVDEDTIMTEFGEEQNHVDDELEQELTRSVDKPAPLFANKESVTATSKQQASPESETAHVPDIDESVATLQGQEVIQSTADRPEYEPELDGRPVVGDLLKIQFVEHQVVPTILDFFFRFPWNNFLHNVVYDVVQQVFNGPLDRGYNRTLAFDLFTPVQSKDGQPLEEGVLLSDRDITERILEGQRASEVSQRENNMRLGYMGHLTLIAEEVCKFGNRQAPELLDPVITDRINRVEWNQYVDGTLAETRERDNAVLGGARPDIAPGTRATDTGGGLGAFSSNTATTLASVGLGPNSAPEDSLSVSERAVGQSFEINHGFGDHDGDEEIDELSPSQGSPFADDEQTSPDANKSNTNVAPLSIPPSRARRTLAARLAQRNQDKASGDDSDTADDAVSEATFVLPDESAEIDLNSAEPGRSDSVGVQSMGSRAFQGATNGASKYSRLFSNLDDSEEEEEQEEEDSDGGSEHSSDGTEEHEAGEYSPQFRAEDERENGDGSGGLGTSHPPRRSSGRWRRRRQSTTEAKERQPLDDGDDDDDDDNDDDNEEQFLGASRLSVAAAAAAAAEGAGEGPFADPDDAEEDRCGGGGGSSGSGSSSDGEMVEMRARRTS